MIGSRQDVHICQGNCNEILLTRVSPHLQYSAYRRALVLLDPYGLDLHWDVVGTAGELRTTKIFLNFPVMDINRNVLRLHPKAVAPTDAARMTAFWGDESWRAIAYPSTQGSLFADDAPVKGPTEAVVAAFHERLKKIAGFSDRSPDSTSQGSRGPSRAVNREARRSVRLFEAPTVSSPRSPRRCGGFAGSVTSAAPPARRSSTSSGVGGHQHPAVACSRDVSGTSIQGSPCDALSEPARALGRSGRASAAAPWHAVQEVAAWAAPGDP